MFYIHFLRNKKLINLDDLKKSGLQQIITTITLGTASNFCFDLDGDGKFGSKHISIPTVCGV